LLLYLGVSSSSRHWLSIRRLLSLFSCWWCLGRRGPYMGARNGMKKWLQA
jgi:hypothetical protein